MRKILGVGLAALAAACGGHSEKPLTYGAPQAPGYAEQGAVANAEWTLEASLASPAPSTEPGMGAPGMGDQLVADLGAATVAARMPTQRSARLAGEATRRAFDSGGMDPNCVLVEQAGGATTVTWNGCHVEIHDVDPTTGDTMDMVMDIGGTLTSNPATGQTSWNITETVAMTMTSSGSVMTMNGTATLDGAMTVTASRIAIGSTSSMNVRANYMGMPIEEAVRTTLDADLGYQADPFCITDGTLTVEQRWLKRPTGATAADLPDQGWQFEWTGCGLFTVAHGS